MNADAPLVSVITPTYNRATLVVRAINSVLAQSFPDWELLVWDDGSTDNTQEVLRKVTDPRVRLFGGENRGKAYARNMAFKESQGKYIALLDDDDEWWADKLAIQVAALERYGYIGVLFSDFVNYNEVTGTRLRAFCAHKDLISGWRSSRLEWGLYLVEDGLLESIVLSNVVLPSTAMLRRDIWSQVGGMKVQLRVGEDLDFWWRCGLEGYSFAYFRSCLAVRRKGRDSATSEGLATLKRHVLALEECLLEAERKGDRRMVAIAKRGLAVGWERLLRQHAVNGDLKGAFAAAARRLRYGFSARSAALLVAAAFGAPAFDRYARLRAGKF